MREAKVETEQQLVLFDLAAAQSLAGVSEDMEKAVSVFKVSKRGKGK
jgi:hypothetical protein